MSSYPLVSICIVNYYGTHLLKDVFDSVFALDYPADKLEVIMVNNSPSDGSTAYVNSNYPKVRTINNEVNNFCLANNLAYRCSQGEYLALLNSDATVDKNWLSELIKVAISDNKIGLLGGKIILQDGRIQSAGHTPYPNGDWGDRGFLEQDKGQYDKLEMVSSVSNSAALYKMKAIKDAGFLDEDFNMYMEDVDIALRLKEKGWKIFYVPTARVYHKLHGSLRDEKQQKFMIERNRLLLLAKHFPEKAADLFFVDGKKLKYNNAEYQLILIAVFYKLMAHHGKQNALAVFSAINHKVVSISERYNNECASQQGSLSAANKASEGIGKSNLTYEKDIELFKLRESNKVLQLEIDKIYNSQTYRFIVRPLIWPILSAIKKIL